MANYYVEFVVGNDANAGTSTGAPFKHCPGDTNATGTAASTTLVAGDTVYFKGGVEYNGTIVMSWSGSGGSPITYDGNSAGSWGAGRAIVDGQGNSLFASATQKAFTSDGQSYLTINNFEIRNLRYVYHDAFGNEAYAIQIYGVGSGIIVSNCYLHSIMKIEEPTVYNTAETGTATNATTFTHTGENFAAYNSSPPEYATYKIWLGWSVSDGDRSWGYIGAVTNGNQTIDVYTDIAMTSTGWNGDDPTGNNGNYFYWIWTLEDGTYSNQGGHGVFVEKHSDVQINDNTIQEMRIGIQVNPKGPTSITDARIYSNDISKVSWGIQGAGTEADGTFTTIRVYNNTIHDFWPYIKDTWGWHSDGMFFWGLTGANAYISDIEIYNNVFYGDFRPYLTALLYMQYGISDITIYNNVFAGFMRDRSGYQLWLNTGDITDALVYNNTFARAAGGDITCTYLRGITGLHLKNNIFYTYSAYAALYYVFDNAKTDFVADYNLLNSTNATDDDIVWGTAGAYSITEWIALGANDQNSVEGGDPLFVNFPTMVAETSVAGSTTQFVFADATGFAVGEKIEHNYDGVVRTVGAADATTVDFTPALGSNSGARDVVMNWGSSTDFTYDLRLSDGSDAIDAGVDLSGIIGSLDADGNTRSGTWDIGAYAFDAGVSQVPRTMYMTRQRNN